MTAASGHRMLSAMSVSIEDLEVTTAMRLLGAGRVRGPQSAVVIGTWGPPEHCEAAAYVNAVGAPEVFALARPGALEDLAVRRGFTPSGRRDVVCVWSFADEPTLLRALTSVGFADAAFTDAILEAVAPYRTIDGGCRLENVFTYLVARAGDTNDRKEP